MTNKPNTPTLPAEWQYDSAILLAWPHIDTDWCDMLDDIQSCYRSLVEAITPYHKIIIVAPDTTIPREQLEGVAVNDIIYIQLPTNDTWTRDYGPISLVDDERNVIVNDFAFNGWGLKFAADRDNLVTSRLAECGVISAPLVNQLGFVLEGGGIDSDGNGTILTTSRCQLSPNRNGDLSREQITNYLVEALGINRILWVDHGYLAGDDTDSHIDTLVRFAPDDTILYVAPPTPDDEHYNPLSMMERQLASFTTIDGQPYTLLPLPMANPVYDSDGLRLPATYANFLATDKAVFVPIYNQPDNDRRALKTIASAFVDRPIISVDCRHLIAQHGSLHCATMQIPVQALNL